MADRDTAHNEENRRRLDQSLRQARLRESAHHDSAFELRDAQSLRLQILYDELQPLVDSRRETADFIDLTLVHSDEPRLWIDLTSYVVMQPDPRTYRLIQDTRRSRTVVAETSERAKMVSAALDFIAHRTVTRQRELPLDHSGAKSDPARYSTAALVLAWLTGFSFGALALIIAKLVLDG